MLHGLLTTYRPVLRRIPVTATGMLTRPVTTSDALSLTFAVTFSTLGVSEMSVITGEANIEAFRLITLRRGFRMEIRSGIKMSSRYNTGNIVRAAIGSTTKNKRKLYAELDAFIVDTLDRPSLPIE
jgi:hypothetical protein